MAQAGSYMSWTYNDNTVKDNGQPESSNIEIAIIPLTAANVVATSTLVDNLTAAFEALSIGNLAKTSLTFERDFISSAPAALQAAQRENKYLIRYHGSTSNRKMSKSLPCADLTKLPNHEEFLDLTADEGLALKTAFEAVVRNDQDETETVIVDSVQFVGRNS